MQTIHKDDLDRKIKLNEVEAFTYEQVKLFAEENMNEIAKSEGSKDEIMKAVADEIKSFSPIKVISANAEGHLQEDFMFVRAAQILWDEPKEGEIQKSRAGTYMNTPENMKLGRVGQKYGAPTEGEADRANAAIKEKKEGYDNEAKDWADNKQKEFEKEHGSKEEIKRKVEELKSGKKKADYEEGNSVTFKHEGKDLKGTIIKVTKTDDGSFGYRIKSGSTEYGGVTSDSITQH